MNLQLLKGIRRVNVRFVFYKNLWGSHGDGCLLDPPPLFRVLKASDVVFATIAVAHVIKTKVLDLVAGSTFRMVLAAAVAVVVLVSVHIVKPKEVQLGVLRLALFQPVGRMNQRSEGFEGSGQKKL